MKYFEIEPGLSVSLVAAGCMRISKMDERSFEEFIGACLESGINLADHADIYGKGESEQVYGKLLKKNPSLRGKIMIQTKCGIIPGLRYDFSQKHILDSVDGSLKRLNTDYLDILLLHRPDALMEPEEVAAAFDKLYSSGKVRYFGVSNFNPYQIELLKKYVRRPLSINQLQFSATYTSMVDFGFNVNTQSSKAVSRDGGVLDYCRLNGITLQAWSPYQKGFFGGTFIGDPEYKELNIKLGEIAEKHSSTPTAVAAAFILRHPAKWQVVTGTTRAGRLKEIASGAKLDLSRAEWYEIYLSAGNNLP